MAAPAAGRLGTGSTTGDGQGPADTGPGHVEAQGAGDTVHKVPQATATPGDTASVATASPQPAGTGHTGPHTARPPAGPVQVPPTLAGPLLRLLVRALHREALDGAGGAITPDLAVFLRALDHAQHHPPAPAVADDGNTAGDDAIVEAPAWATAAQLSAATGHPARTLRHWAAAGRLRAVRAGRTWLIEVESLKEPARADPNAVQPSPVPTT